jgi:hypothetical protein
MTGGGNGRELLRGFVDEDDVGVGVTPEKGEAFAIGRPAEVEDLFRGE